MNKLTSAVSFSFAALLLLSACGSGSGSGSVSTRAISGTLSGDLSSISGVQAVRTSDGAIYKGTTTSSARSTALTGTSAGFQVVVPVNNSYTLDLVGSDDTTVASVQFSSSSTGANTTNKIPVTAGASTSIDLGVVTIPAGTGATTGATATVTPSTNPLTEVDSDDDGINDFEDDDDDNDGIADDNESDDDSTDSSSDSDSSGDSSSDSGSSHDSSSDSGSSDDSSSDSDSSDDSSSDS